MTWGLLSSSPFSQAILRVNSVCDAMFLLPMLSRLGALMERDMTTEWKSMVVVASQPAEELLELALERGLSRVQSRVSILPNFRSNAEPIDTIYCVDRGYRAGFAAWQSQARCRVGFSSGASTFFYTDPVIRKWSGMYPEIERNLDLLRARWPEVVEPWDPALAPSLLAREGKVSCSSADPIVIITVSAPDVGRHWPETHLADLCHRLTTQGVEVWLVGEASATRGAEAVQKRCPSLLVKNLCRDRELADFVDLIAESHLVVSTDMLGVQIASDLKIPVIAMYAASVSELGLGPWRRKASALGVAGLRCKACDREAMGRVSVLRHVCVQDIDGARVYREARRLVEFLS